MNNAASDELSTSDRNQIKIAVSGFLASAGEHGERSQYIAQLADGAFNYYSLAVPPEVVEKIRQQLPDLILLMDTNFLFGILGLHYNSQVEISHDIIRTVRERGLPFRLRYHEATQRELINTITGMGYNLRDRKWSRSLSRAAIHSGNLTGLELKYHSKNASQSLDVDELLRPYRHVDPLLKDKGMDIFRPDEDRLKERSDLFHLYKKYLEKLGRTEKTDDVIQHDVTILDAVRHRRNQNQAAIEGGSLLLTCDYTLYRFDWETSREYGGQPCVVLPNMLWQILRPILPADKNFEKSFASTFAIPEFRAIGSGSSRACSRILSILASWEDVPEETALKLLSSEILIDQLKITADDKEFEKQVKQAFIEQNATLLEEKSSLENQIKEEKLKRENDLVREQQLKEKIHGLEHETKEKERSSEETVSELQSTLEATSGALAEEKKTSKGAMAEKDFHEERSYKFSLIAGVFIGLFMGGAFLVAVRLLPWAWLLAHPNKLPIQIAIIAMLILGPIGLFVPKWRKYCWGGTGIAGIAFVLLTLLGGGDVEKP